MLSHFSHVWLFATPWTIGSQAPLSIGILQARILDWFATPSSRASSLPRDGTCVYSISCTGRRVLYISATWVISWKAERQVMHPKTHSQWWSLGNRNRLCCLSYLWHLLNLQNDNRIYSVKYASKLFKYSAVQSLRHVRLFVTPWTAACQASLAITNSRSLLKLMTSCWWCHPTILSSVVPFSHLQSFPASESFPMCQFFASGGQSIGVSTSTSVFPMNI